ncbi:MAG: S41 family peptidase [Terriglobales bacterium]
MSRKASLTVLVVSLLVAATLLAGAVRHANRQEDAGGPLKQLGIMVEVYQHINDDYVSTPDLAKVSGGALHGLVDSLDADSSYLDPSEYQAFLAAQKNPPSAGVQAVVSKRVGYADVVSVEPGGNAAAAGLVAGDFIEAIDNQGTRDMSLEEIRRRLHGAAGQSVTLSVVQLHHTDPDRVVVTFAVPHPAPLGSALQNGVGVITVPDLTAGRAGQIAAAVKKLQGQGARGVLLDLRDCGAGTYAEAEKVANLFLAQGTITYLEGQDYPKVLTTASAHAAVAPSLPLDVLINFGTYGPAELAAAALQQNGRAKLVGDHSFGEGSVQKLIPVGDGSALWLTVARYYSPKGKLIEDGLTPDVQQVRYAGALPDLDVPPEGVSAQQPDLQLQKGLSLLANPAPAAASVAAGGGR